MDEQIKALEAIKKDGVQVFKVVDSISKVPETAFDKTNPRVIYLFDFADWDKVNDEISRAGRDRESAMYFPTLYMSSSLYVAAQLLVTGGNVSAIGDALASSIIKNLYSAVLGREATDADLIQLFRSPWEILPDIVRLTENINALRTAIVQIEKAA